MSDNVEINVNLLLFSVGGVHFGVDAEQVTEIAAYGGEPFDDLHWFHTELEYDGVPPTYHSPTIVTVRTKNDQSYRVIIDSMEDITEFNQNDINLFPPLLEPFAIRRGLWGVLHGNGHLVLLIDFQLLLKQNRSKIN